jgi:hypothetical protein
MLLLISVTRILTVLVKTVIKYQEFGRMQFVLRNVEMVDSFILLAMMEIITMEMDVHLSVLLKQDIFVRTEVFGVLQFVS